MLPIRFNEKNYFSWEFQFWMFDKGTELWGHIDGTIPISRIQSNSLSGRHMMPELLIGSQVIDAVTGVKRTQNSTPSTVTVGIGTLGGYFSTVVEVISRIDDRTSQDSPLSKLNQKNQQE